MHHRSLRRSSVLIVAAAVALPAGAALAQVPTPKLPPVPTVTPPVPVPTVTPPVPVPKLPDVPVPDLPVPDLPDVPDVPAVPDVPVPDLPALPGGGGGGGGSGSGGGSGAGSQPAGGGSAPASGGGRASGGGGDSGGGGGGTSGTSGTGGGGAAGAGGATSAAGGAARSAPGRAGRGRERGVRARRASAAPTPRVRRERRLRRVVAQLAGCLDEVAAVERRVLVLRAGTGPRRPLTRQAVAVRLDASVRRVARMERRGVRHLRAAARSGACGGFEPGAAAAPAADGGAGGAAGSAVLVRDDPIAGGERLGTARSGVKDEFATGPAPGPATLLPPGTDGSGDEVGGRGMSVPLLLLAAFVAGFAFVWTLQGRRGGARTA